MAIADQERVEEATRWIGMKVTETLKRGAQEVGEYVLREFFEDDPELAKSMNPYKNASYRALAARCRTSALPITKTWLNNAVGIALMIRQLPESATAFKRLPPSFQEVLLPLGDPERVEGMASHALTNELSFRQLRRAVVTDNASRARKGPQQNQRFAPTIMEALSRSRKAFGLDSGKRFFPTAQIDELSSQQQKDAAKAAEMLIETLRNLILQLRASR
jgi:hypothetical protein